MPKKKKQITNSGKRLVNLHPRRKGFKPRRFHRPLTIYLTEAQETEIQKRAEAQNATISRFAREKLLRGMEGALPAKTHQVVLRQLAAAMTKTRELLFDLDPSSGTAKKIDWILLHQTAAVVATRQII